MSEPIDLKQYLAGVSLQWDESCKLTKPGFRLFAADPAFQSLTQSLTLEAKSDAQLLAMARRCDQLEARVRAQDKIQGHLQEKLLDERARRIATKQKLRSATALIAELMRRPEGEVEELVDAVEQRVDLKGEASRRLIKMDANANTWDASWEWKRNAVKITDVTAS